VVGAAGFFLTGVFGEAGSELTSFTYSTILLAIKEASSFYSSLPFTSFTSYVSLSACMHMSITLLEVIKAFSSCFTFFSGLTILTCSLIATYSILGA